MKKIIKALMAGIFVPAMAVTFYHSSNAINKPAVPSRVSAPYIIETIAISGERIEEFRGVSNSMDYYQIAIDLGAKPNIEDKFTAFPDIKMGMGSKITIHRAPSLTISDGKKKIEIRSWAGTVSDLLKEAKIPEIGVDDKINFSLETALENNMQVKINRVAKTTVVEKEPVKYTTTKKSNPNLEKGNKKVLQAGKNGVKNKFYAVTREDGVEISRKLSKTEVAEAPVEEILEVGTKVVTYGSGKATWYKRIDTMVAAHNTLPKGTKVKVINTANGKSCVVTIDDRGIQGSAVIDLSDDAFAAIGSLGSGVINVRMEKYYPED